MNLKCIFPVAILWCILLAGGCACPKADAQPHGKAVVGGPCEYRSYPGEARIVSIKKVVPEANAQPAGPSAKGYDVTFIFHTDRIIEEPYVKVQEKPHRLLLTNGSRPSARFLKKYGIEEGKTYPCRLQVITKGTCTPVLFDFPTIDLSDYSLH